MMKSLLFFTSIIALYYMRRLNGIEPIIVNDDYLDNSGDLDRYPIIYFDDCAYSGNQLSKFI